MKFTLLLFFTLIFLISCNSDGLFNEKWKTRGNVSSLGIEIDAKYINLNDIIGTANYDTVEFKTLKELLTINNKTPKENKSFFIVPFEKQINDESVCCEYDTVFYNTEVIKNKKFLFLSYKNAGSITVLESSKLGGEELKRENINIPSWGVRVGTFVPDSLIVNKLDDTIAIDGSRHRTQFLKSNNNVFVSTLKFENTKNSLIFYVEKEITSQECEETLRYIKDKYPMFRIKENYESLIEGEKKTRIIEISYRGYWLRMRESNSGKYTMHITDDYSLVKTLLEKEGKKGFKIVRERELVVQGDPNFWKN